MYNKKVIIINGMARGGTNVVWNLLQSHPSIVSPIKETGEVIYPAWMSMGPLRAFRIPMRTLLKYNISALLRYADKKLYCKKMCTIDNKENRYKNENEEYTIQEIKEAVLVTKSLNKDIFFTPALAEYFPQSHVVSVIRNGLSVCEGWIRRGVSPENVARKYKNIMDEILKQDSNMSNHLIVKFEDCLENPLGAVGRICQFANLDANKIDKLRVKAKNILQHDGLSRAPFGEAGQKVWINVEDAQFFFDTLVTQRQIENLKPKDKAIIVDIIAGTMERLGYVL